MIKPSHIVRLLVISCALSTPLFADSYSVTFTPESGSTGGSIAAATSSFTSGPLTIDWGTDVFTLSASDLSEILSDCGPLSGTPKICASYSASDAGIYEPTMDVGPLLGIDDNGGSKSPFTLLASSANPTCAFLGCDSFGSVSITDLSVSSAVTAPEPGTLGMLLPGLLALVLLVGIKRPEGSRG